MSQKPETCITCGKITTATVLKADSKIYCFQCAFPHSEVRIEKCKQCGLDTYNRQPAKDGNIYCLQHLPQEGPCNFTSRVHGSMQKIVTVMKKCVMCHEFVVEKDGINRRWGFICNECVTETKTDMTDMHVRLKVSGTTENLAFFNWLLKRLDADWPQEEKKLHCEKCGGAEYKNPRMKPQHVKALGVLCRLRKVKVKYWGKAVKCVMQKQVMGVQGLIEGMVK